MGGRLLGGWIHPPLHWRYAFVTASLLLVTAVIAASRWLPQEHRETTIDARHARLIDLLGEPALLRIFAVAFGAYFVFASMFNYFPFYLSQPPFSAPTEVITLMYLAYLIGILMGPLSGRLSNCLGNGATIVLGTSVLAAAIASTLIQSLAVIAVSLVAMCAGFFTIHAAAIGLLNRRIISSRGRANSLYVLFYYLGGAAGITACGYAYTSHGWFGATALNIAVLLLPLGIGFIEIVQGGKGSPPNDNC